MDYIINGGKKLCGEIAVYGAKNCALALLGATPLTDEEIVLTNCPQIVDVDNMLALLAAMGKSVSRSGSTVRVSGAVDTTSVPSQFAGLLRGSGLLLGSLVSRYGQATLPVTGGCAIGSRPMDIHFDGLRRFGVDVNAEQNLVVCDGFPDGAKYSLRFASVGATENLVCAAARGRGEFVLSNCALEPEVTALCEMLEKMGAKIDGKNKSVKTICGVDRLHGTTFDVIPDRIVTCTYLAAGAITCGDVRVTNCRPKSVSAFLRFLLRGGATIQTERTSVRVVAKKMRGYGRVMTAPYPFFPTDAQSLALSLAACAKRGKTEIIETLFENRLAHNVGQLRKMGAKIRLYDNIALVVGENLAGAKIVGNDLRGEAALIVAALAAYGQTVVKDISHSCRGYIRLDSCLRSLGADISQK